MQKYGPVTSDWVQVNKGVRQLGLRSVIILVKNSRECGNEEKSGWFYRRDNSWRLNADLLSNLRSFDEYCLY